MHGVGVAPLPGEGEGTGVGVAPLPGEGEGTGVGMAPVPGEGEGTGVGMAPVPGEGEGTGVGGSPYCWHEHKHTLLLPSTLLPQPLSRERIPLLAGHSAHYNALLSSGVSSPGLIAQYISLPVPLLFLSRCMEHC